MYLQNCKPLGFFTHQRITALDFKLQCKIIPFTKLLVVTWTVLIRGEHKTFLGNSPPTPPLSQHFALLQATILP